MKVEQHSVKWGVPGAHPQLARLKQLSQTRMMCKVFGEISVSPTCQRKSSREFLLKGDLFSILWSRFSVGCEQILLKFITRIGPLESLEKGFFPTDFISFPSLSISAWRKGFRHLRHLLNLCYFCCKPFMSPRISCKWGYLQDGVVGINILKLLSKCDRWKESVQVSTPSHRKFWQLWKSSSSISHYLTFTKQMPHRFQYEKLWRQTKCLHIPLQITYIGKKNLVRGWTVGVAKLFTGPTQKKKKPTKPR